MTSPVARILLVDDMEANRYVLARVLKIAGYEVCEAESAAQALKLARERPSLIILDVGLPDGDGRDVCKELKDDPTTCMIPVIQMSAKFIHDNSLVEALEGGADGYLIQPIDPPVLIATVRALLRLSKVEAERAELFEKERLARKDAEAERGKLEEAVRVRDEFLSLASHELKTPLTTLKLQNQLRRRKLKNGDETMLKVEALELVFAKDGHQLARLGQLLDNMLDITRITAGKLDLNREEADLSKVVDEIVQGFEAEFAAAGCVVTVSLDHCVVGDWDPFRIEQVLVNLLSNAVKYAPGKPIHVSLKRGDDEAVLKVKDHGRGIAPADQARIFSRFERAMPRNGISGLGLGLYILKEITEAHGGTVAVDSDIDQGSTFTVTLPLSQRPAREAPVGLAQIPESGLDQAPNLLASAIHLS